MVKKLFGTSLFRIYCNENGDLSGGGISDKSDVTCHNYGKIDILRESTVPMEMILVGNNPISQQKILQGVSQKSWCLIY